MNILAEIRSRFTGALEGLAENPAELAELIRPTQDPKFGDYQANLAMPLGKQLGRSAKEAREVAAEIVDKLQIDDLCEPPEVAGPGFINLRLKGDWLVAQLDAAFHDERLGVEKVAEPQTIVVDYSAPNVAKPMHVGHIRSTVIGDALYRILQFLGHQVISDNHIGDWGTQFGMIIYGHRHFLDQETYQTDVVGELSRVYRLVRQLMDYHEARQKLPQLKEELSGLEEDLADLDARSPEDKKEKKALKKERKSLQNRIEEFREAIQSGEAKIERVEASAELNKLAAEHKDINQHVHEETAKLHAGDAENLKLWKEVLPPSLEAIHAIYSRLGISFDYALGESFYHDQLADVVQSLREHGIASESQGAVCVFLADIDAPFIVQKSDGAYLYATTDLATIRYRMDKFHPNSILYVVDDRQSLHFQQLFATARKWGYEDVELQHISFGKVLGKEGKPFKTREGDTVGLESLLDTAIAKAADVVQANALEGWSEEDIRRIAEAVGLGAIKYADLSQNRTSDYVFDYDKMVALNGNTATYMQYAYTRCQSIIRKSGEDIKAIRQLEQPFVIDHPAERALALELLKFSEALAAVVPDYRPNLLTSYLFDLGKTYSTFFDQCPVIKAESPELRSSRLALCDLTARTLKQGLHLLGIEVVEKM